MCKVSNQKEKEKPMEVYEKYRRARSRWKRKALEKVDYNVVEESRGKGERKEKEKGKGEEDEKPIKVEVLEDKMESL